MTNSHIFTTNISLARTLNRAGLEHFERWELETAMTLFQEATRLDAEQADYHLNLARAHARMGDYETMLRALGNYLHVENDAVLINRFEALFSNGLDRVEELLTAIMRNRGIQLELIGAAIQMWMEYRVTIGKRYLDTSYPEAWAAALDYTVRKINFADVPLKNVIDWYKTSEDMVRANQYQLIETLDVMPCDYRYFRGQNNPLDKLVEAASNLEELATQFRTIT